MIYFYVYVFGEFEWVWAQEDEFWVMKGIGGVFSRIMGVKGILKFLKLISNPCKVLNIVTTLTHTLFFFP